MDVHCNSALRNSAPSPTPSRASHAGEAGLAVPTQLGDPGIDRYASKHAAERGPARRCCCLGGERAELVAVPRAPGPTATQAKVQCGRWGARRGQLCIHRRPRGVPPTWQRHGARTIFFHVWPGCAVGSCRPAVTVGAVARRTWSGWSPIWSLATSSLARQSSRTLQTT